MQDYQYVGVDISKAKFDVCFAASKQNHNAQKVYTNTLSGHKLFLRVLKKKYTQPWVCMESTGIYSEPLARFLHKSGVKVSIVNPMKIKNFARTLLSRNKNDTIDARIIQQYGEKVGDLKPFVPRSQAEMALRGFRQVIDSLEQHKGQVTAQLETILDTKVRTEVKRIIQSIDKRIARLTLKLEAVVKNDEVLSFRFAQLVSVKGFADKTAYDLLVKLPELTNYKHAKQLAAYAGLCPRQKQSGQSIGVTKLSKLGHSGLRKSLYMPALVVKNHNPGFKAFCKRLEQNGLKPKQIICAVMRKLLHIIFGMFKSNSMYDPNLV